MRERESERERNENTERSCGKLFASLTIVCIPKNRQPQTPRKQWESAREQTCMIASPDTHHITYQSYAGRGCKISITYFTTDLRGKKRIEKKPKKRTKKAQLLVNLWLLIYLSCCCLCLFVCLFVVAVVVVIVVGVCDFIVGFVTVCCLFCCYCRVVQRPLDVVVCFLVVYL